MSAFMTLQTSQNPKTLLHLLHAWFFHAHSVTINSPNQKKTINTQLTHNQLFHPNQKLKRNNLNFSFSLVNDVALMRTLWVEIYMQNLLSCTCWSFPIQSYPKNFWTKNFCLIPVLGGKYKLESRSMTVHWNRKLLHHTFFTNMLHFISIVIG